ncbi:helix-turn-helix domain-containing protein [Anaerosalibacter bizertensis]|uniref:Helix-turn-helix domain-containing protein n=1 Tax=Anaerosalibacter bizertensis TaxID=932217 RepID=A0A9Q4AEB7_9FIRM|nr:helix-turn-helix domain-containing protein [Anaerosalibacter bizertensis]MBV1821185.1 helix-turn-helix domain-containing protein [Bacteroidales bacterium MSK.15.36]MCB5560641.1 helix-turn-helix domain-containing protein [Anaerosalibacter bizertensis]MCG4566100.1 helix-turn-helix domain-containing protein [Anaerosalibacter bizertensis]MCG4583575.1 helix-turn-helix domain-containing protein [Anaerosalibacter bizertensis]MCG4586403.1 helix-turn-helix domain-containing protein [Anaerosalibacter
MSTLGERIKTLRSRYDLTQEDFGKMFNIVKSTVSMYENNKSIPDDETKKRIAEHFNVTLDWLMGYSDISCTEKETNNDEIIKIIENLDSDIILLLKDLEKMSKKENEALIIFLEGLKARRNNHL